MKITLKENGTFEHYWPTDAPIEAIEVDGATALELGNNPSTKAYIDGAIVEYTAPLELSVVKQGKLRELKMEGLSRISVVLPGIKDWDILELERERWLSIVPSARQATAEYQEVIDTYQAGRSAAITINALNDIATVQAYDVVINPTWP